MREHAIPQDVTGYRFHIIGSMTLKQFAEVGAGVIVGVLIYTTNLPAIIKWPMICIVVGLGAAAAFVPLEERPFDHWIVTFFKVLYKPTKFFWKRQSKVPEAFLFNANVATQNTPSELDLRPARRERIKEYLTSVEPLPQLNQLDTNELNRLSEIMNAFSTVQAQTLSVNKGAHKPDLKVRVRTIKPHTADLDFIQDRLEQQQKEQTLVAEETQAEVEVQQQKQQLQVQQVAQEIQIPEVEEISIEGNPITAEDVAYQNGNGNADERAYVGAIDTAAPAAAGQSATTNVDLPFPSPPTEPNKLVGMILSQTNNLINDAIIEIVDETGRVARAVKSNALGQFFITTPLADGTYAISVEHDGYQFEPISLQLQGNVVPPIEIRSTT